LKAGFHGKAEERNVLGVVLKAKEEGCQVVAFVRDRNDCIQRELDVENGIEKAKNVFLKGPRIIGGVAIKKLESWIVALSGRKKSETLERPEDYLRGIGIGIKDTQGMVNIVDYSRMDEIPDDAMSLKKWLDQAQFVLNDETLVEAK
jgi:hypothetical protein